MKAILTFLSAIILSTSCAYAGDLEIRLTNLRNDQGNIAIAIYNNENSFKNNNLASAPYVMLLNASGTKTLALHDLPAGKYAISILHDEDKDGGLDTNSRGFPTEGYAYSNNVGKASMPTYAKASFTHTEQTNTVQNIKMVYIK